MTDKIAVLSACESEEQALRIARRLIERHLAACVNIVPGLTSVYRWKGAIEESREWLLIIKTRRELFGVLRSELEREHSYEVPEILALPIVDGAEAYLRWLEAETGGGG